VIRYFIFVFLPAILPVTGFSQEKTPVAIIFDSDMGPDYDDVGALAALHAMADKGEATILATMASTKYEGVAAVLDILNTYFKRSDIPIGVPKGNAIDTKDFQHWTDTLLARYSHSVASNHDVPDAVTLYRRLLSQQPDHSVTIVTVGFLTNISNLLRSPGDKYSPLPGIDLVRKKVKQMVSMAGAFPSGSEFNVRMDASSAKNALENFPAPVLYTGVEIGRRIKTGLPLIHNTSIRNSPVKDVYRICINMTEEDREGRMSWDQTAVLVAVRGTAPWYNVQRGHIRIDEKGSNQWDVKANEQGYLTEQTSPDVVAAMIDGLMMHQPGR
jgi:pyrimidine-specific ribonucleoside hydrolase